MIPALREFEAEAIPANKGPSLPAFTDLSGFWDLADLEVPHLFGNSMPMGELSVIASEPGVGKTTLVIGLALSVALGRGLIAGFTPQRRGKVALLLAEDGPIPTAQRVRGWCEAEGVSRADLEAAVTQGRLKIICGESAQLLDFSTGTCRRTRAYDELMDECRAERWDRSSTRPNTPGSTSPISSTSPATNPGPGFFSRPSPCSPTCAIAARKWPSPFP